ncbi:MAG: lipopolysaccharide heptosyltransferase I [Chromatiales bacterium]
MVVKTSSLGDVVHMLPAVTDLRRALPKLHIDWLVEENFADVPRLHPAVNRVLTVAWRRWRGQLTAARAYRETVAFLHDLRTERYDCVLDSQGLIKSAVMAIFARGPVSGHDRHSAREPLATFFYRSRLGVPRSLHAVTRNRLLAALALGVSPGEGLPDYGISIADITTPNLSQPYVVCLHGTSRVTKEWPTGYWRELTTHLCRYDMATLLPWGNERERLRAEAIAGRNGFTRVLPRLGLGDLARVLAGARAVIGVDTGLSHLAVALGRPTVAIYVDSSPMLTGLLGSLPEQAVNLGGACVVVHPAEVLTHLDAMRVLA